MSKGEERTEHVGLLFFLIHLSLNCCTKPLGQMVQSTLTFQTENLLQADADSDMYLHTLFGGHVPSFNGWLSYSISCVVLCPFNLFPVRVLFFLCLEASLVGIYTSAKWIDNTGPLICKHFVFTWKKHKALGMGAYLWIFQAAGDNSGGGLGSSTCPAAPQWEETAFPSAGVGFASFCEGYYILKYNTTAISMS